MKVLLADYFGGEKIKKIKTKEYAQSVLDFNSRMEDRETHGGDMVKGFVHGGLRSLMGRDDDDDPIVCIATFVVPFTLCGVSAIYA